jgi:hypothetical protein
MQYAVPPSNHPHRLAPLRHSDYSSQSIRHSNQPTIHHILQPRNHKRLGLLLLVPPNFNLVPSETCRMASRNKRPSLPKRTLLMASRP